ncbi:hypothetical protein CD58_12215 [Pseudomonas brassicacearum]|nr:hypothetical protein CD58_12215 [Pseudomonas brassicacearum]
MLIEPRLDGVLGLLLGGYLVHGVLTKKSCRRGLSSTITVWMADPSKHLSVGSALELFLFQILHGAGFLAKAWFRAAGSMPR